MVLAWIFAGASCTGCWSSTANNGGPSTGGSAGTAGGGSGGSSGATAGGSGGTGGSGGSVSTPTLASVRRLAKVGDQRATALDVSPSSGGLFVLGHGNLDNIATNFLVEVGSPDGPAEVSRNEFTTTGQAFLLGLTMGTTGLAHVVGIYQGSLTFSPTKTVNDPGGWGAAVARMDPANVAGTTVAYTYAGPGEQGLRGSARYGSGIVSAGQLKAPAKIHGVERAADADGDAILATEFTASAERRFTALSGPGAQSFQAVSTEQGARVVAVGETPAVGGVTVLGTGASGQLAVAVAYPWDLSQPEWTVAIGSGGSDAFSGIARDPKSGDYVAVGWAAGKVDTGTGPPTTHGGGEDVLVARFTEQGSLLWAKTWGGSANDRAYGVTFAGGDTFVAGQTLSPTIDFGAGPRSKLGKEDGFLLRLDASGNPRWASLFGAAGADSCGAMTTTPAGDAAVVCRHQGAVQLLGLTVQASPNVGSLWDLSVLTLTP
jgi:hypothetical protein